MTYTIAQYRTEYTRADALCSEVYNFRDEASLPAINELRYAGHHFLQAFDDAGTLIEQHHLDSAMGHVRRASYEATDAGISFAVRMVEKFQKDFSTIPVSGLVPDYTGKVMLTIEGQRLIETPRQAGEDRTADHDKRIEVFRKIRPFVAELAIARDEANKLVRDARTKARRFILTTVIAILGILIAAAVTAYYATRSPSTPTAGAVASPPTQPRVAGVKADPIPADQASSNKR